MLAEVCGSSIYLQIAHLRASISGTRGRDIDTARRLRIAILARVIGEIAHR
jgi:hypothetical protein